MTGSAPGTGLPERGTPVDVMKPGFSVRYLLPGWNRNGIWLPQTDVRAVFEPVCCHNGRYVPPSE